jgi:hypothetical protein
VRWYSLGCKRQANPVDLFNEPLHRTLRDPTVNPEKHRAGGVLHDDRADIIYRSGYRI